jgi:hypothetical protein
MTTGNIGPAAFAALWLTSGCEGAPTPEPIGETGAAIMPVACTLSSIQLWDTTDTSGHTICFDQPGTLNLGSYCRIPTLGGCSASWSGAVRSYTPGRLAGYFYKPHSPPCYELFSNVAWQGHTLGGNCAPGATQLTLDAPPACPVYTITTVISEFSGIDQSGLLLLGGLNDSRIVVGTAAWFNGVGDSIFGFLWAPNGGLSQISPAQPFGYTGAAAVNNAGDVAGWDEDTTTGITQAALFGGVSFYSYIGQTNDNADSISNSSRVSITGAGGGDYAVFNAVTGTLDRHTIAGATVSHTVISNAGVVVNSSQNGVTSASFEPNGPLLATLGGAQAAAFGLNDAGAATGWAETTGGANHAVLWPANQPPLDLGVLSGATASGGVSVNAANWVVGTSGSQSFLWENGNLHDLRYILDPVSFAEYRAQNFSNATPAQLQNVSAAGINTGGDIAVKWTDPYVGPSVYLLSLYEGCTVH